MATSDENDNAVEDLVESDPDVQRMLRVREDDREAFEELIAEYQHRVLGILTHLTGRPDEAEDLTQEVFLRLYRARKGYKPRALFTTWLFTVTNNVALNYLRGKGRSRLVPMGGGGTDSSAGDRPEAHKAVAPGGTASAQMRQAELTDVVREAVAHLDDDQRMAVLLNKFEGMSYAQIAEVMGKSQPAIKSLLARARMNLRDHLEPYLRSGDRGGRR